MALSWLWEKWNHYVCRRVLFYLLVQQFADVFNIDVLELITLYMNRSTCTSELSIKNMFSEKIHIHVNPYVILGTVPSTVVFRTDKATLVVGWNHCYQMLTVMEVYMLYFVLHYDLLLNRKTEKSSFFFYSKLIDKLGILLDTQYRKLTCLKKYISFNMKHPWK
jgi:hypothetical protein